MYKISRLSTAGWELTTGEEINLDIYGIIRSISPLDNSITPMYSFTQKFLGQCYESTLFLRDSIIYN